LLRGLGIYSKIHITPRRAGALFAVRLDGRCVWLRNTTSDTSIFFQIMVQREYETGEWPTLHERLMRRYEHLIESGRAPVIIDAGANIGLASLWFADKFPQARIYAVEPEESNLALLRRNVASLPNIAALAGAVWDHPAQLKIRNPDAGAGAFRTVEAAGSVRALTIPEIASAHDDDLFIAKIDIEGGEAALFRSNTGWCGTANLVILELHDWLYPGERTSQNFLRVASQLDVDFVIRGENVFCFRFD